jgi:uncharacterized membrane protein
MNLKLIFSGILLVVGIVLIVMASQSMDTFGEKVSKEFSGNYSDSTMRNLIIGIVLAVAGAGLLVFGWKRKK